MPKVVLKECTASDIDDLTMMLTEVSASLRDVPLTKDDYRELILNSFNEGVHWFLFLDGDDIVGTCHLQTTFRYFSKSVTYHLGGFYIREAYRGRGSFKQSYTQLQSWVKAQGGIKIIAHISKNNDKSLQAFSSVGLQERDHKLHVDFLD